MKLDLDRIETAMHRVFRTSCKARHRRETVTDLRTLRALERAGWIREAAPGDWQQGRRYVDPVDEGAHPVHGKYSLAYRDGCFFPYVIRPR